MNKRAVILILAAGLLLSACGGGGGGSGAGSAFSLFFDAPAGSGLTGGVAGGVPFQPAVSRDLVLDNGIAVSGVVTDSLGAPLSSANVTFFSALGLPDTASDGADGAGAYGVTLPAGTWIAVVDSGSSTLGSMTVAGIAVVAPGPVVQDFQFSGEVTVSGMVLDPMGLPVPATDLTFKGSQSGVDLQVTTDLNGFYTLTFAPDSYEVTVAPTGLPAVTLLKQRWSQINFVATTTRDFNLTTGVQVSGTILTNVGAPLLDSTDVDVVLAPTSSFFAPSNVTADSNNGTYSIGPVPLGGVSFRLTPPSNSGFPEQLVNASITGPTAQTQDFTLQLGFVLSGTVLQDDGATPAVNAKVRATPVNPAIPTPDSDRTDGFGFYEISVFPGTYTVTVTPDTTANQQLPFQQVQVVTQATVLNMTLSRGAFISGQVLDTLGVNPMADIRVEITGVAGASSTTDSAGAYTFLAPVGTHTLTLSATNGPLEDMALAPVVGVVVALPGPVVTNITLAFATTGSTVVTGTVYMPDGTTPAVGSQVTAVDATGSTIGRTVSGPGGIYVLVIP